MYVKRALAVANAFDLPIPIATCQFRSRGSIVCAEALLETTTPDRPSGSNASPRHIVSREECSQPLHSFSYHRCCRFQLVMRSLSGQPLEGRAQDAPSIPRPGANCSFGPVVHATACEAGSRA